MKNTSAADGENGVKAPAAASARQLVSELPAQLTRVRVADCVPGPGFNRESLGLTPDFCQSVRERGVLVPALVRWQVKSAAYEIIAGHRRWEAARQEKLEEWPVSIVEADDRLVRELRLVENLQRTDLTALDEARQYQEALASGDYGSGKEAVKALAVRLGRGMTGVYDKLQLLKASKPVLKLVACGELEWSTALLLSRVPGERQGEALEEVMGGADDAMDAGPMTYRQAQEHIRENYQRALKTARFDVADAKLTKAGACGPCPFRSGNIEGNTAGDNLCTNVDCFEAKEKASVDKKLAEAKAKGQRVMDAKEFDRVRFGGSYVDLEQNCGEDPKYRKWRSLLGKHAPAPVLAVTRDGEVKELLPKEAALKALKAAGVKLERPSNDYEKKRREETKVRQARNRVLDKVIPVATLSIGCKSFGEPDVAFWRLLAQLAVHVTSWTAHSAFWKEKHPDKKETTAVSHDAWCLKYVEGLKAAGDLRHFALNIFALDEPLNRYQGEFTESFRSLCDWAGVDLKKLEAAEVAKKEGKAEGKRLKAKVGTETKAKGQTLKAKVPAGKKGRGK